MLHVGVEHGFERKTTALADLYKLHEAESVQ